MFHRLRHLVPSLATRTNSKLTGPLAALLGATVGLAASNLAFADKSVAEESQHQRPRHVECEFLICGGGVAAQEALGVFIDHERAHNLLLVSPEWRDLPASPTESLHVTPSSGVIPWIARKLSVPLSWSAPPNVPELLIGPKVTALDPASRVAVLDDGSTVSFDKCLIAVGASAPPIPLGKVVSHNAASLVATAHTQADRRTLDNITSHPTSAPQTTSTRRPHVTIVGGDWMSVIIGARAISQGAQVTFSYADPSFLSRSLPKYLAQDVYHRLFSRAHGAVDLLSYSALRYVVARPPLKLPARASFEAEVHVGTVFDAFSIVDFRTDLVVFAPTLPPSAPVHAPTLLRLDGAFAPNGELAVSSDIYVAGAAAACGSGDLQYSPALRWSAAHARATGRHAASNMLGGREPFAGSSPLDIDLSHLALRVKILGSVDGSKESFGYFVRARRGQDDRTCGGTIERGIFFCVEVAPLRFRGASQQLVISGVALWDGVVGGALTNSDEILLAAELLLDGKGMSRPELEAKMDEFVRKHVGISLKNDEDHAGNTDASEGRVGGRGGGVIWRRHQPARIVPLRKEELLWVEDEWVGAVSPVTEADRKAEAYAQLLRRSAGQEY